MRLDEIRFDNFRCFESREFKLASRFNLLIGDNGTGKTSILQGISIGLGSIFLGFPEPAEQSAVGHELARTKTFWNDDKPNIQPQYPIRIQCKGLLNDRPVIWGKEITRAGGKTIDTFSGILKAMAERIANQVAENDPVTLPVLGYYGTGRIWNVKKLTEIKLVTPGSRFMAYLNCLDPASDEKRLLEWFKSRELVALQKSKKLDDLEAVRKAIQTCVSDADRVFWDMETDQLTIRRGMDAHSFHQLSDGYRNMLGMVADIAERCVTLNPQLGENAIQETPGVILIDEIDLHLHPKWQRRVVDDLLRTFPKIQFVATTHSPFIIQSLEAREEVRLINLDNAAANDFADKSVEDIAEQIQGAGEQTRSERYQHMMATAEEYFKLLDSAEKTDPIQLQSVKDRLDELASRYSDDPAYHAMLKVEREARLGSNGANHAAG